MNNKNFYAVIMAGGVGSRFWPMSTTENPKQFHDMMGCGQSLLQKTYHRLAGVIPPQNIWVLTHARYTKKVASQLPEIQVNQIVAEPAMRNTAPCILLAALKIFKQNEDAQMLVAPSDHWIEDEATFHKNLREGFLHSATNKALLTLGITPTYPNTGYGYIESASKEEAFTKVVQFREKPDFNTAKSFFNVGNFYWNAGIFMWNASAIIEAFKKYMPTMYAHFIKGMPVYNTEEEGAFLELHYPQAENISIDYAILEKANNVWVQQAEFDWNDLGTWGALYEKLEKDTTQNAVVNAKTYFNEATGNMVATSQKKLIVVDGLDDYIIVDKDDVLLIYPKKKEQDIKALVKNVSNLHGAQYT